MISQPSLRTERLLLRPFTLADAPRVQQLAGAHEVAARTLLIPHPYPDGAAEEWIATHAEDFARRQSVTYAIVIAADEALCGAIGLSINNTHERAELGYWVGVSYWGQGYCTEATRALIGFAFEALALNKVGAHHFTSNPASGRVMQKVGLRYEGRQRQHYKKWGVFEDVDCYGLLRAEWSAE